MEEKYLLPLSVANVAIANSFSQAPKFEVVMGKIFTSPLCCECRNSQFIFLSTYMWSAKNELVKTYADNKPETGKYFSHCCLLPVACCLLPPIRPQLKMGKLFYTR
ncbi:hypothetical protein D5R40_23040 [Okeania hirsuta]|uniref:Uncharacterized protein n=1 Tax=Okeania hirsuta TaxID=1458930 RepID=A0A3N6P4A3_9CYAN|nr:hypothetical protein D5R40_23040 [Okeania hirsuta]